MLEAMKSNYASIIEWETSRLADDSSNPFVFDNIPFADALFYITRTINILEERKKEIEERRKQQQGIIVDGIARPK